MKLTITLPESPSRTSEVLIAEGVLGNLPSYLDLSRNSRSVYWIWDEHVWRLWSSASLHFGLPALDSGRVVLFAASESNKRLAAVEDLARALIRQGADRQSSLVAVGGGVTGDVVGVLASLYMRGIPFFQVPTTLLAQVDSSIGGKTGVDLPEGKNLLGTFHQPRNVWIDPQFLKTLPDLELRQGMAEVIKTAMLGDEDLWLFLEKHGDSVKSRDGKTLAQMIYACCRVKASVVEADEKEAGRRRILNLGHTTGHALERLSRYDLRHGDAVAMGMIVAARLAVRLGKLSEEVFCRLEELCRCWELPVRLPGQYSPEAIVDAMGSDKKKMAEKLHFILPVKIGEVVDCINPDVKLLMEVISELRS